jgi:hypothetical protein
MNTGNKSSRGFIAYDPKGHIEAGMTALEYNFNLTLEGLHFSSK